MRDSLRTFVAILGLAVATATSSAAVLSLDSFEAYTNNQAIGTSATSTPWLRFGGVADNLVATTSSPLDGSVSAKIPVSVTTSTSATIRYNNFGSATNLSLYKSATVLTKSLAASPTTQLQLSITNATTSYTSNALLVESTSGQSLTFYLDNPAVFARASGSDSFATVLSTVTAIGFRITSTSATTVNETLVFDDFSLSTVPEPASAGGLVFASWAGFLRRRRR